MPLSCPGGDKPRYRVTKAKKGKRRRLAFCGPTKVVENVAFKPKAKKKK